jgi:hypothetical protein
MLNSSPDKVLIFKYLSTTEGRQQKALSPTIKQMLTLNKNGEKEFQQTLDFSKEK